MHDFKVSWRHLVPTVYYFLYRLNHLNFGSNWWQCFCDVNPILTNISARHPLLEKWWPLNWFLFLFSSDSPESDEINTESMQHVISYLHEDLSLPIYNKTAELSFEDVFCILTSNLKSQICIRTPFDVK